MCNSCLGPAGYVAWRHLKGCCNRPRTLRCNHVSAGGTSSAALFVDSSKLSQSALRKFQRFKGLPDTGCSRDGAVINGGLWWERGNISRNLQRRRPTSRKRLPSK